MAQDEKPTGTLEIANVRDVAVEDIKEAVRAFWDAGFRFVTMTGFDRGDTREVLYHFDENLELHHLRVVLQPGADLPSISDIYLCAFLVENEIKELFGINVTDLAIDYHGRLLIAENCPTAPMLKDLAQIAAANEKNSAVKVIRTRSAKPEEAAPDAKAKNAAKGAE